VSRILMPLASGYKMGVALRRALYRRGWLKTRRLKQPVVSVGNLSVGGTGKTPLVEYLAQRLLARGWKPCILTRGYGRRTGAETVAVAPEDGRAPEAREIGDEPALLARRLPQVPIVVSADRYRAGCVAETQFGVDVHILDDGFQHWALERDVDVVVLDTTQPLADAALLPAGRLREPCRALGRAHFIIFSRAELGEPVEVEKQVRKVNSDARIFRSTTRLANILEVAGGELQESDAWTRKPLLAFCGIGNPRAFFADARRWGFSLAAESAFRDHHFYDEEDLGRLVRRARRLGAEALLTTEKDVMNFPAGWKPEMPVAACVIETEVCQAEILEAALIERLEIARSRA
jgi:tetraacyldisaccharide 4'-kinase